LLGTAVIGWLDTDAAKRLKTNNINGLLIE
jgi:hypothetical protein